MSAEAESRQLAYRAITLLDLTELGDAAGEREIEILCRKARGTAYVPMVAAVCVWPRHVAQAQSALHGTPIRLASVVNFPSGEQVLGDILSETHAALAAGADEIDLVFPWRAFLAGDVAGAEDVVAKIRAVLPAGRILKVILETGSYPDLASIRHAADSAIRTGAHFVKTSTGKAGSGASPEAARTMLNAILSSPRAVGLKPSGGIRTLADAALYMSLSDDMMGPGWAQPETFRLGASGLYDALAAVLTGGPSKSAEGVY
ncbi:DeoC Deoxyribose-phosphate aldolase [Rhabdaerophilaceae bacterium]